MADLNTALKKLNLGLCMILFMVTSGTLFSQTTHNDLAGTWERNVQGTTLSIVFDKDGGYQVEFTGDGITDVTGQCKIEKDRITFNDTGGMAADEPGVYSFKIENDKITFGIINDPSNGRSGLLAGIWTRKNE